MTTVTANRTALLQAAYQYKAGAEHGGQGGNKCIRGMPVKAGIIRTTAWGSVVIGALSLATPAMASGPEFTATYTCDLFGAVIPVDASMARGSGRCSPRFPPHR